MSLESNTATWTVATVTLRDQIYIRKVYATDRQLKMWAIKTLVNILSA